MRIAFLKMVKLERNFKIQLVPSSPVLQMACPGGTGGVTFPSDTSAGVGVGRGAELPTTHPHHCLGIFPATPSSVVLLRQVLPPWQGDPSSSRSIWIAGEGGPGWQSGQAGRQPNVHTISTTSNRHTHSMREGSVTLRPSERLIDR